MVYFFIIQTTSVAQRNCQAELQECQNLLYPTYQQPAELLKRFQNCILSLYEEELKNKQCEIKREELLEKTSLSCPDANSQNPIGVEGRWVQIVDRAQPPQDAVKNLDEGDLIAWPDYVARTWVGENTVPCRTDFVTFWGWWDGKLIITKTFEILVGNYKWLWTNSSAPIPNNALIGGYRVIPGSNNNREMLYVGRAIHDNFQNHDVTPNRLLLGHVHGQTRELVQVAWVSMERKTIYQILVKP
ncbi:hypothetical protein B566_EDAN002141 [Ephemera danica]|nr:hypothetical protein B566_EDAN002141 [Ephemera danica]